MKSHLSHSSPAAHTALDAESDALSLLKRAKVLENIKRSLSKAEGGLLA